MDLSPAVDDAARIDMFQTMVLVRTFEDALLRELHAGAESTELRLSAGREPVAVGVCAHLKAGDILSTARRPHHLAIAHGMDLRKLAAESLAGEGRESREGAERAVRRNRWHLFDPDIHFVSSATLAEGYPPALGRAFAFQQNDSGRVAVAVTDGTAARHEGFREALSLAALWSLPLVFVVEDDDWGCDLPRSAGVAAGGSVRTAPYGVPAERVEDNAVETVYEAAARAVDRARRGGGPSVIEVHTARLWKSPEPEVPEPTRREQAVSGLDGPHGAHGAAEGFRPRSRALRVRPDVYEVVGRDPVPTYELALREHGCLDEARVRRIRDQALTAVTEAIRYALAPGRAEAVWAGSTWGQGSPVGS